MRKVEHERRNKIRPKDVVDFKKLQNVKKAINLLGKSTNKMRCTKTVFVLVQDFVITKIFIHNGHLPYDHGRI